MFHRNGLVFHLNRWVFHRNGWVFREYQTLLAIDRHDSRKSTLEDHDENSNTPHIYFVTGYMNFNFRFNNTKKQQPRRRK